MRSRKLRRSGVREDLIKGAIAGAVATWVMDMVSNVTYGREARRARRRGHDAYGGKTASGTAVEQTARAAGVPPRDEPREKLGSALHWALGIGAGAAYAVLRHRFESIGRAAGFGFGSAFWAALDEGLVPALGLPRQPRASGLAGRLTFGTVTAGTLRLLDAIV
jgi:hypothetical protein